MVVSVPAMKTSIFGLIDRLMTIYARRSKPLQICWIFADELFCTQNIDVQNKPNNKKKRPRTIFKMFDAPVLCRP